MAFTKGREFSIGRFPHNFTAVSISLTGNLLVMSRPFGAVETFLSQAFLIKDVLDFPVMTLPKEIIVFMKITYLELADRDV